MPWWWVLLLFPLPAIADNSTIGSAVPPISEALIWGVIGACVILLTLWWRYVRPKLSSTSALSAMTVIAECRLGVKQKLVVVQVGEAQWAHRVLPAK